MQYSLEARGFASMANVRWSDGSIGSIGQGILRSDKYSTDGELTNPVKATKITFCDFSNLQHAAFSCL